jgi:ABC-type bacteriocin/lantibiotic exporter with double-glycine peptidase domain
MKLNPGDFSENQKLCHCGLASLMYCLRVYGVTTTQKELRKAAGVGLISVLLNGTEPDNIHAAATKYGFSAIENTWEDRDKFERRIRSRAKRGLPSIVLVGNYSHWIAVVGYDNEKFVIRDPISKTKKVFYHQTHIQNSCNEGEFCALFVNRNKHGSR